MAWSLNKLLKTAIRTYIPGAPGVVGDPGRPPTPAYSYWDDAEVPGGIGVGSTVPEGAFVTSVIEYEGSLLYFYITPATTMRVRVDVPASPGIPPTPAIPATATQVIEDYNLGWNSGATGPAVLAEGNAITWRFDRSSVGAAVGVTVIGGLQMNTYKEMRLCVIGMSGLFSIVDNGVALPGAYRFSNDDVFAITHASGGVLRVAVNGAVMHEIAVSAPVLPDSSLYSAYDVIYDAAEVTVATVAMYTDIGATTNTDGHASPAVTVMFGPGTERGIVGGTTITDGDVGFVSVNGTTMAWGRGVTETDGEAAGVITRTLGPGTALGIAGASTETDGAALYLEDGPALGSADNEFEPLITSGSGPGVYRGWTGHSSNGFVTAMAPLTSYADDDSFIVPVIGLGDAALVPLTTSGYSATGEITISSDAEMAPMLAIGGDYDYAQGSAYFEALTSYGSDLDAGLFSTGNAAFGFTSHGWGHEEPINGGFARLLNVFSSSGYGGGQANADLAFTGESSGTVEIVGHGYAELTFTSEAEGLIGILGGTGDVIPSFSFEGAAQGGAIASAAIAFTSAGTAVVGIVGRQAANMPLFVSTGSGYLENAGRADDQDMPLFVSLYGLHSADMPLFVSRATGSGVATIFKAYAVNKKTNALTEYTGFNFRHLVQFAGQAIAFTDDGAFILGGDLDDAAEIDAVFELAPSDFDSSHLKRVPYAYLGVKSSAALAVYMIADENAYVASLTATNGRTRRAKLARGVKGRFWAARVANKNGEDFAVDSFEYLPEILGRKV